MSAHRKTQAYLDSSARLLAHSDPTTSRYLMSISHTHHVLSLSRATEIASSDTCTRCGTIYEPGWTCKSSIQQLGGDSRPSTSKRRGRRVAGKLAGSPIARRKEVVFTCKTCGGERSEALEASGAAVRAVKGKIERDSTEEQRRTGADEKRSRTSSDEVDSKVKKRRKAKSGGLKALVARSREDVRKQKEGYGVGLMDFMKRS